jgi:hypothetical protein
MCDMMDSFNSDNIDRFSNIVAAKFAKDNDMPAVAGSDSHMLSTLGEWVKILSSLRTTSTPSRRSHEARTGQGRRPGLRRKGRALRVRGLHLA